MTRAEDSLLVTLDAERGTHPFVVESIAPQRSDELAALRARRNDAAIEARDAAAEVNALESDFVRLHDGELLTDSERALRELPARISQLDTALRPLEDELARLNRARDIRGRRRAELTRKADELRVEREQAQTDLDESNQHVRYLRGDPTAHGRVIEVRLEDARRRFDDLVGEQERLDQRLIELDILTSAGSGPKAT
jgi:chromosome segregation ATPase